MNTKTKWKKLINTIISSLRSKNSNRLIMLGKNLSLRALSNQVSSMPLSCRKQQSTETNYPDNTTSCNRNLRVMMSRTPASTTQELRLLMMKTMLSSQCLVTPVDKWIFLSPTSQDLTVEVPKSKTSGQMAPLPKALESQLRTLLDTLSQYISLCQKLIA